MRSRRYSELVRLSTFEERYEYLRLGGTVGESTFGFDRYLNQGFYKSKQWRQLRDEIIIRDDGLDLGVTGYPIVERIIVHHMNPMRPDDLDEMSGDILHPEYLICVSPETHNAIHFGDPSLLRKKPVERYRGDTLLW